MRLRGRALNAAVAVGTAIVAVAVASMVLRGRPIEVFYDRWMLHNGPVAVVMLWMGRLILRRRSGHGAGLVLLAMGAVAAVNVGVMAVVDAQLVLHGVDDLAPGTTLVPGDLPLGASVPFWVNTWLWVPMPVLAMTLLLLVFPDGGLPAGRWRWGAVSALVGTGLLMVAFGIVTWPTTSRPVSSTHVPVLDHPVSAAFAVVGAAAVFVSTIMAVLVLVSRWRRAEGEQRRPFRAVGTAAVALVLAVMLTGLWPAAGRAALLAGLVGLVLTYALAVARYRLHDLEPVLGRAAVAALLAAGATGIYIAIVVGVGSLVGGRGDSTLLPLIAVGVVAVLIEPARREARRFVDRVLYGREAERVEVLSRLAEVTSTASGADDVLDHVVGLLLRSTGAQRAETWLEAEGGARLVAAAGTSASDEPLIRAPIVHQEDVLGEVRLHARHRSDLVNDVDRLVGDVTYSLGVFLRAVRLATELQDNVAELRRSRQRLVEVHDRARRELERDIHDGAQARLIALRMRVGAAREIAAGAADGALSEHLGAIGEELDAAVRSLRDLARGLHPPVLEEAGLVAALQAAARGLPLPVQVHAHGVGRYARAVEAAVYFACLEAVQNAVRHAAASRLVIDLHGEVDQLRFSVVDDGVGFDPVRPAAGHGLININDRIAALGGRVRVCAAPGEGTAISGEIPVHASFSAR